MSTLQLSEIHSLTANTPPVIRDNQNAEIGAFCRAWVNFNGTGTVAIRAALNVTSITDGGTGVYVINMTNPLPDANYAMAFSCNDNNNASVNSIIYYPEGGAATTTSFAVAAVNTSSGALDLSAITVAVFR